jgi:hypothetical protein
MLDIDGAACDATEQPHHVGQPGLCGGVGHVDDGACFADMRNERAPPVPRQTWRALTAGCGDRTSNHRPGTRGADARRTRAVQQQDRQGAVHRQRQRQAHVARLLAKLGARDRIQLVITAYEAGLVSPYRRTPPLGYEKSRRLSSLII